MDKVILCEVFRELKTLEVVRVNSVSYYILPEGLSCGKQYFVSKGMDWDSCDNYQRDYNRAFGVVFATIENSPNHKMITCQFEFCMDRDNISGPELFDPTSQE